MGKYKLVIKKGFTMAELLIVLGIIGVIATIMIPTLMSAIPSKYETLGKKAAYMLETAVFGIVNNEVYYEKRDLIDNATHAITHIHGLQNTYPVNVLGTVFGSNDPDSEEAEQKFCQIFASKFQLKEGTTVNCSSDADFVVNSSQVGSLVPTFTSVEGIQWILPVSDFSTNALILYKTSADYKSGPNCAYVSQEYYNNYISAYKPSNSSFPYIKTVREDCPRPDIFIYGITPGGKLYKEEATSDKVPERNDFIPPAQ